MTTEREAEVLDRLGRVTDPELDEPVTELGFVTAVTVTDDGAVRVEFRLPTYWCAANFAFMMADDMRSEIAALPWVTRVEPHLGEHMYADKINDGVARNLSFADAFGDAADGDGDRDLRTLRQTFLVKAFQRRQEALLRHLLAAGHAAGTLAALSLSGLSELSLDAAGERLRARYVERRAIAGAVAGPIVGPIVGAIVGAGALAFVDTDGMAIAADELPAHLRALRRVGTNAEFNGALCSGLLAARFGQDQPSVDGEPTLLDFARMGPARQTQTQTQAPRLGPRLGPEAPAPP
jgi:metal-sulfur cluster biosynthetic enzyme